MRTAVRFVVALLVSLPLASLAAPPQDLSAPVTVVNGETEPVPVTIQGSTSVSVEGGESAIPVVIQGHTFTNVRLQGSQDCSETQGDGTTVPGACSTRLDTGTYTVPDHKLLLIEYVSVFSTASDVEGSAIIVAGETNSLSVDPRHALGVLSPPGGGYVAFTIPNGSGLGFSQSLGRSVMIPLEPGTTFFVSVQFDDVFEQFSHAVVAHLAGRLLDAD